MSNTRYNARGYDVRLEVHGVRTACGRMGGHTPLRNLEPGFDWPAGPPAMFFMDRLAEAFRVELGTFADVVAGMQVSPCTVDDALAVTWMAEAATLSAREHRPVRIDEVRRWTAHKPSDPPSRPLCPRRIP